MSEFAMKRTCAECPWRRDVPTGRFPPERYQSLESTCRPGGLPVIFACHKSPVGEEKACAGFLLVHGEDNNRCRLAAIQGRWRPGEQEAAGPLYTSFDEMAAANGFVMTENNTQELIQKLTKEWSQARRNKDFVRSDEIREELARLGFDVIKHYHEKNPPRPPVIRDPGDQYGVWNFRDRPSKEKG